MSEVIITDANFEEEVTNSDKPVVVDFWAVWCGPCRNLAPIIEELANDFKGKIKVGKLDVDTSPLASNKFSVMSIPTVIYFESGVEVKRLVGVHDKANYVSEFGLDK